MNFKQNTISDISDIWAIERFVDGTGNFVLAGNWMQADFIVVPASGFFITVSPSELIEALESSRRRSSTERKKRTDVAAL